jgi:uncharacterized membrane protein
MEGIILKRIRIITSAFCAVLILGFIIFLVLSWKNIPETVATHFNASGAADAYGSKRSLIMEPVLMVIFFLVLSLVERFPSLWNMPVKLTAENRERQLMIAALMLGIMKVLVILLLADAGMSSIFPGFPVWPLYLLLTLTGITVVGGIIASIKLR